MDVDDAMALFAALEREDVAYVLVGALAMALQGEVRATQDIDLFVSAGTQNVARLRRALEPVFEDPHIAEITSEDLAGEYSVVRYVPPSGAYAISSHLASRRGVRLRGPAVGGRGPRGRGNPGRNAQDVVRDEA